MNTTLPTGNRKPGRRAGLHPRRIASTGWLLISLVTLIVAPFWLAGATGNALWIAAPVAVTLLYVLARERRRCLAFYRSLWPRAWLPALGWALLALATTLGFGNLIDRAPAGTPLDWSLGLLFNVHGDAGVNGFAIPLATPWLALLYVPPALLSLPLLAWWEEEMFRRGTRGLRSACVRSVWFGLLHLTAGVSLGSCIALGAAGLLFSLVYWRALHSSSWAEARDELPPRARSLLLPVGDGAQARETYAVYRATQVHLLYNVIGVLAIVATSGI